MHHSRAGAISLHTDWTQQEQGAHSSKDTAQATGITVHRPSPTAHQTTDAPGARTPGPSPQTCAQQHPQQSQSSHPCSPMDTRSRDKNTLCLNICVNFHICRWRSRHQPYMHDTHAPIHVTHTVGRKASQDNIAPHGKQQAQYQQQAVGCYAAVATTFYKPPSYSTVNRTPPPPTGLPSKAQTLPHCKSGPTQPACAVSLSRAPALSQ
jgi:hypothetical protein